MTDDKASREQDQIWADIAARNYYAGSVHQGDALKAREFAYAQGYLHGLTSARSAAPPVAPPAQDEGLLREALEKVLTWPLPNGTVETYSLPKWLAQQARAALAGGPK